MADPRDPEDPKDTAGEEAPSLEDRTETLMAHHGEDRAAYHGAVVPPVFRSSLFTFDGWDAIDRAFDERGDSYIYSRQRNPTVEVAERKIAALAGGDRARLFASGMAAISAAVLYCLEPGAHVVAVKNVYGPASNFLGRYLARKMGVETTFVGGERVSDFEQALREDTRLIYLESPSSVVYSLQDIAAVATLARSRGIRTVIDNTWATPIFQRPLDLGVDLEVHSCSKYLAGHSDVVAGVVIGGEADLRALALDEGELLGGILPPAEAWLITRSLRTLPIRMRQHQESTLQVARFLEGHPAVRRVLYPGLDSFPQTELARRQMSGFSGLLSIELATDDLRTIQRVIEALRLFQLGVSWGGHESLVYAPAISYLKELPPERFASLGITVGTLRLSIGLEHAADLVADLDQALGAV